MSIKLLTISRSSWNDNNGIGNTFSNLFEGWEKNEIANLYCCAELPKNNVCSKYYSIAEAQLVRSLFGLNLSAGDAFIIDNKETDKIPGEKGSFADNYEHKGERCVYNFFRTYRFSFFLMLQDLIWLFGHWKTKKLNAFLDEFTPDVIFMPAFQSRYPHRILWYVQKRTNAKVILFHADDYVTFCQYSFSPLFWINRILGRRAIKKSVKLSSLNYSSQHKVDELQKILQVTLKTLYKCGDFTADAPVKCQTGDFIRLIYTGNVGGGRWRTLVKIGEVLSRINIDGTKAQLDIYTLTPLTDFMKSKLDDGKNFFLRGSLAGDQVRAVQESADILVHVESFEQKDLLQARLSFSTKIVDYLQQAKCILAVGSRACASIDYIETNGAGVIAVDEKEIYEKLLMLVDAPEIIIEYGYKAYACGAKNHQSEKIKEMIKSDMFFIINNS